MNKKSLDETIKKMVKAEIGKKELKEVVERDVTFDNGSIHIIKSDTGGVEMRINKKPPYLFFSKSQVSALVKALLGK